jgi:ElaB/YqjD/DUF883 family membrane-anchored ribosome-binding protein
MKSQALEAQIEQYNQEIKQDLMLLRFKTQPKVLRAQIKEVLGPPALLKGVIHMINPMENGKVKGKVESVKEGVASAASSVKEVLGDASNTVKDVIQSAGSTIKDAVLHPESKQPVEAIKKGLDAVSHTVQEGVSSAGATLKDTTHKIKEGVGSLTHEVTHQLKDQSQRMKATVSENPWVTTLIVSGAVLTVAGLAIAMSTSQHKQSELNLKQEIDRFQDDGNPNTDTSQGFIEDEHTQYGPSRVQSRISGLLHQQPLLVGSGALLLGATVGALLPRSSYEDQMLGQSSDRLIDNVKETVSGTFQDVKMEARKQVEDLRHMAVETGHEVKQTVLNSLASL